MNDLTDQFDAAPDTGEMGRTFSFRGVPLKRASWHHRMAWWRIAPANQFAKLERAVTLLYMLTLDARAVSAATEKADEDKIRFDAIAWAENLGLNDPKFRDDALAKMEQIENDVQQAASVEPNAPPTPGNA